MSEGPVWITEADVVSLVSLADAIPALERVLAMEASGEAENMVKTHLGFGDHNTLHAIGAAGPGAGLVGTKTWCHTAGGAAPVLILWNSDDGSLQAVVEAFALGQMRTGAISGVATKWLSQPGADELAIIGTGKQAVTQVAAVHAVRPIRNLRVFSPTEAHRNEFAGRMAGEFGFSVTVADSVSEAVRDAPIVTAVTLARSPFLEAEMIAQGAHVNAVGAIVPERVEFTQDVFSRCGVIAVDNLPGVRNMSQEFREYFGSDDGAWKQVRPLSEVVAEGKGRPGEADLTLFKAMGMGISDLAMGIEILSRAQKAGIGQALPERVRAAPRLQAGE